MPATWLAAKDYYAVDDPTLALALAVAAYLPSTADVPSFLPHACVRRLSGLAVGPLDLQRSSR